jgi:hypothetical protein
MQPVEEEKMFLIDLQLKKFRHMNDYFVVALSGISSSLMEEERKSPVAYKLPSYFIHTEQSTLHFIHTE